MKKIFYTLALILSVLTSCKKDKPEEDPEGPPPGELSQKLKLPLGAPVGSAVQKEIGAAGGVIQSPDGVIKITVPAGAVDVPTAFSVQEVTNTLETRARSYRLRPEGVNFKKPLTVTYRYAGIDIGSIDPRMLFLAFQDKDGYYYSANKTKGDLNNHTLTVETTHFSDWTFYSRYDLNIDGGRKEGGRVFLRESEKVKVNVYVSPKSEGEDDIDELLSPLYDPVMSSVQWDFSPKKGSLQISVDRIASYQAPAKISRTEEIVITATLTGDIGKDNQGNPVRLMQLVQPVVLENDDYFILSEDGEEMVAADFSATLIEGMGVQLSARFPNGYNLSAYTYGSAVASYPYNMHGVAGSATLELVGQDQRSFIVYRAEDCFNGNGQAIFSPGAFVLKSVGHTAGKYFEGEFTCTMFRFDFCNSTVKKSISGRFKIRKQG
ncbi:hypothetical protein LZZ85_13450 [Terrimonas sp. NA20]|uniref:ZU5 domain-containing protein n=1 Tax=Terrimonas ginsenosidimutans TaxID=2908004 RepID=A0ABS9KSK4_9BACT|nr:hypothetical protein [Terrimonas ginsenosidimutans]MCG2615299.1 hypothetical protein [Terrimonas ginsenosidimutans]